MLKKLLWTLAITTGCLLALSSPTPAQKEKEKKVEPTKEEIQRERMQKLMSTYELADQGRKKNAPEFLITAAGMLRQLSAIKDLNEMKADDVKPEITGDGALLKKDAKAPSLREQSEEWFQEASDMGATLKVNVDKLIKLAKDRAAEEESKLPDEQRSVIGGPRKVSKMIGAGQTHAYTYTLKTGNYTEWFFQSNAPLLVTVVRGDGTPLVAGTTTFVSRSWYPNKGWSALPQVPITIRVTNQLMKPAAYQMTIQ